MQKLLILIFAMMTWAACQPPASQEGADTADAHEEHAGHEDHGEDVAAIEGDGIHFGETIDENNAESLTSLLTKMAESDSVNTKVVGTVSEVCQVKGCWMTLAPNAEDAEPMIVQFKDYGFFMPKDIAGREVIVEGYAYRELTSVDELKHLAEDAGKSADEIAAITEPKEELKFLASGVILVPEAAE